MFKNPRYGAVKVLIETGHITSIRDIFQFIPKTTVYKDLGINFNRFERAIADPSIFKMQELVDLADMFGELKERAKGLKSQAQVLVLAYKDKRTPAIAKFLIWITVAYLLNPIDLIPDFIPILGLLDDLIIVPGLIAWSIRLIPKVVIAEARGKLLNDPQVLKKNNGFFAAFIILLWIIMLIYAIRLFT